LKWKIIKLFNLNSLQISLVKNKIKITQIPSIAHYNQASGALLESEANCSNACAQVKWQKQVSLLSRISHGAKSCQASIQQRDSHHQQALHNLTLHIRGN
jgi:hypothetical protein